MDVVTWRKENQVAVVEMCNGANRQNIVFAEALAQCLDQVEEDSEIQSVILTSTDEKNFSQGIDVEWMSEKMNAQDNEAIISFMYAMNENFKRLLFFPVPVIAAINGHAFGNGAIITCACDFRFMRKDKGFFCFPEVNIGIPFLPGMLAFSRKAIPEPLFNYLLLAGHRATAPELEAGGAIVKACADQEELMKEALSFAESFAKKRGIFRELKKRKHKELVQVMEEQDPEFIDAVNLFVAD